jgi:hypothetical protein
MNDDVYYESQKFNQRWVLWLQWLLGVGALVITWLVLILKKAPLPVALIPLLLVATVILFFSKLSLQLRITEESILYRFSPLQRRFRVISKADIASMEIRSYDPLSDYGGWGIRFGKKGIAYTVKGHTGIAIRLHSDTHILIGTSRPQEAEAYLRLKHYL